MIRCWCVSTRSPLVVVGGARFRRNTVEVYDSLMEEVADSESENVDVVPCCFKRL